MHTVLNNLIKNKNVDIKFGKTLIWYAQNRQIISTFGNDKTKEPNT